MKTGNLERSFSRWKGKEDRRRKFAYAKFWCLSETRDEKKKKEKKDEGRKENKSGTFPISGGRERLKRVG